MLINRMVSAAVAAGLLGSATPSFATTIVTTFSGTISRGVDGDGGRDVLGLFGAANADLFGAAFTVVYTVDDAATAIVASSLQQTTMAGGTYYGPTTPSPITATLQINGHTYQYAAPQVQYYAYLTLENAAVGVEDGVTYSIQGPLNGAGYVTSDVFTRVTSTTNDFMNSTDIHVPLDRTVAAGDIPYGYAHIGAYGGSRDIFGLSITRVTVVPHVDAALPEPATWATMIAGFALLGGAMRRRNVPRSPAAA